MSDATVPMREASPIAHPTPTAQWALSEVMVEASKQAAVRRFLFDEPFVSVDEVAYAPHFVEAHSNRQDRMFSVLDGCGADQDETWLFCLSGGVVGMLLVSRSRDGGRTFEPNASAVLAGHIAHNTAIAWQKRHRRNSRQHPRANPTLLLIGGRFGRLDGWKLAADSFPPPNLKNGKATAAGTQPITGMRPVLHAGSMVGQHAPFVASLGSPVAPLIDSSSTRCFEGLANLHGVCSFDGRNSVVRWRRAVWVFARMNVRPGVRYVQATHTMGANPLSDERPSWVNWRPIEIRGFGQNEIDRTNL